MMPTLFGGIGDVDIVVQMEGEMGFAAELLLPDLFKFYKTEEIM